MAGQRQWQTGGGVEPWQQQDVRFRPIWLLVRAVLDLKAKLRVASNDDGYKCAVLSLHIDFWVARNATLGPDNDGDGLSSTSRTKSSGLGLVFEGVVGEHIRRT